MKSFITVLFLFASASTFALDYYWNQSAVSCHAYTVCPNGRTISCQTFGYNYSSVPATMSNSCRWMVVPGRAVRCQGYVGQRDYYGRVLWGYADIPLSCF